MSQQVPRGRFVWYDLMTRDVDAATRFYTTVVGWGTQVWSAGAQPYTMWTVNQTPIGGVMAMPPEVRGMPPHWIGYISVPCVDETVRLATSLGASERVPAADIPTVGRFAVLADPQGATFALFTPAGQPPAPEPETGVGFISWHELITTDRESAFAFYQQLFGWRETSSFDMGSAGTYQTFGRGDVPIGAMYNGSGERWPSWLLYARVPDINVAAERVRAEGGVLRTGPMEVPGGDRIVVLDDPQGGRFALFQLKGT